VPTVPVFDHIFVIIMENHSASQVLGSADAPFINDLAASYGTAANYTAIAHPSLPNYLALTGGSTFGVSTDCTDCFQNAPNIAVDRVADAGRTWRGYMESMPSAAFVGDAYPYMQKHNAFVYYDNIRTDPAQFANVVPYTQLAADLASAGTSPSYGWITPNMTDDMHDGTVAQGDTWLSVAVPALLSSDAFTQRQSLLFITWDENDDAPGNEVATLVIAKGIPAGFKSQVPYTHYSLLRTIEESWGLAPLTANDAAAPPMSDFFDRAGLAPLRPRGAHVPAAPSIRSRSKSAWPLCLAYSSIMWTYTQRTLTSVSRCAWWNVSSRPRPAVASRQRSISRR
jgi:phosphatidylinositol-3-phosphatase